MSDDYSAQPDVAPPPASLVPPPPPVIGQAGGYGAPPVRPATATVIGIILLVFAGFGLLTLVFAAMQSNPEMELHIARTALVASCQLVMGAGLLAWKPWARKGAIIFLALDAVGVLCYQVYHLMKAYTLLTSLHSMRSEYMSVGFVLVGAASILFPMLTNAVMTFFLARPAFIEVYERRL